MIVNFLHHVRKNWGCFCWTCIVVTPPKKMPKHLFPRMVLIRWSEPPPRCSTSSSSSASILEDAFIPMRNHGFTQQNPWKIIGTSSNHWKKGKTVWRKWKWYGMMGALEICSGQNSEVIAHSLEYKWNHWIYVYRLPQWPIFGISQQCPTSTLKTLSPCTLEHIWNYKQLQSVRWKGDEGWWLILLWNCVYTLSFRASNCPTSIF